MSSIKSPFREDLCKNSSIIYLWSTCSRRGEPVEPKHLVLLHLLLHSHSLYPLPTPPDTQCTATARTRPTFELDRHPALLGCEINMKIMCKNWAHSPCLVSETDHSCLVVLYANPCLAIYINDTVLYCNPSMRKCVHVTFFVIIR